MPALVPALEKFVADLVETGVSLDGLLVWQHGAVVHEQYWWPSGPDVPHMLHSATKSFTGTAAGIAIGEGLLAPDDLVADLLAGQLAKPADGNIARMRVTDLLTMRSGHASGLSGQRTRLHDGDLVAAILAEPVELVPGTAFVYSSATSHVLSAVVQHVTGMPVASYLDSRLFGPLGIVDVRWDADGRGVSTGGNGLRLKLADFMKWGILHLQDGVWEGRRVLPAGWVEEASRPHVRNVTDTEWDGRRFRPAEEKKRGEHYGYQIWVRDGYYFAGGMFGQYVFVCPEIDAVIATMGSIGEAGHLKLPETLDRHLGLEPRSDRTVPTGSPSLVARADETSLPPALAPLARTAPPPEMLGRFVVTDDEGPLTGFELRADDRQVTLTLHGAGGTSAVSAGLDDWIEQTTSLGAPDLHHSYPLTEEPTLARVTALEGDVLEITVRFPQTAFRDRFKLTLGPDEFTLERSTNVNSGALSWPPLRAARPRVSPVPS